MTEIRPTIRIDKLTKRFREQTAVEGLSLEVPEGAVYGLLGENGAGKTTTLQMLLGLLAPDGGRVEVLGLNPARRGLEVRRKVGYVPEVPALYEWMTVGEQAQQHLEGRRLARPILAEQAIDGALGYLE